MRWSFVAVGLAGCGGEDPCGDRAHLSGGICVQDADERADTDGDGLFDAEEERLGTDPTADDTDGDGYRDGDELDEGSDPLDPASVIYEGGWPYNPRKNALPAPGAEGGPAVIGEPFARLQAYDQYGDVVDLYDFSGHGKDVVVHIVAIWAHAWELSDWLGGDGSGYPQYTALHEQVAAGELYWVTLVTEDIEGSAPDVDDVALWAETFPHERIPVLAANAAVAEAYVWVYPTLYLLDDSMRIVAMQGDGGTPYDVLDAAATR
jgi:hypothetical protein